MKICPEALIIREMQSKKLVRKKKKKLVRNHFSLDIKLDMFSDGVVWGNSSLRDVLIDISF